MSERASTSLFTLHDLLLDIIRRAQSTIPFDSGGLALYDPGTRTLTPSIYLSSAGTTPFPIPLGTGIIGRVAQTRDVILVEDMTTDPRCLFIDPTSRSQLAVPVMLDHTLLGVFNVENCQPNVYQPHHIPALKTLADQAALVLHLSRQYDQLADSHRDLLADMRVRLREMTALQRLTTITSAMVNLDQMLTDALRETAELLDCEGAQLLLPDHISYELEVHRPSTYGIGQFFHEGTLPLDGPGYLVDVYHTGRAAIFNSRPPEAPADYQNVLGCPLNTRNRTLGVLHLINQRTGSFNKAQIEIAQTIANQIALSMGSLAVFDSERRRAEMMNRINRLSQEFYATLETQALIRRTVDEVREIFEHDAVYLLLIDDNGTTLSVRACAAATPMLYLDSSTSWPVTEGILGRAIRTGETQVVPDVRNDADYVHYNDHHNLQSFLIVLLRHEGQVIGAIEVVSTQLDAFSEIECDGMETLATQVSIALENARLYDQAQRRLLEQRIVHQIGQDLTSILNYNELTQAMVRHMNRALNTSSCMVGLYDTLHHAVFVEADYRAPHHEFQKGSLAKGTRLDLGEHYAMAQAIRTRQPVTVYLHDSHVHQQAHDWMERMGNQSQLILPMYAGERVIGVVEWADQLVGRVFTEDDILLAQTLVLQGTIALDNAMLFRQLEQRAVELSEANRLRSEFLATISHELRTPMNSIIGFSDTLLGGIYGDLNETQTSRVERILKNGRHLLTLIDDLLDISKIDAGRMDMHMDRMDLRSTIQAVVQSIEAQATAKGLNVAVNIPNGLPPVIADPQRLEQVVTNLLSNAVKFTEEGGITVSAQESRYEDRLYVEVTVADSGIGITPEDQRIIFDEFRQADGSPTRSYGGTGLGLAISKKLVELMEGAIWVESVPGQGSRFTFTLPAARG
ncbi:MAG TPA: GAF domain-containing protein [Aggregatilineaceae bacterium]|nr:GAF domain-containing protein [Aggregatilineaceae bacterium]